MSAKWTGCIFAKNITKNWQFVPSKAYVLLTKCHYSVQILDVILIKYCKNESMRFYFYLYGVLQDRLWNRKGSWIQKFWKSLFYDLELQNFGLCILGSRENFNIIFFPWWDSESLITNKALTINNNQLEAMLLQDVTICSEFIFPNFDKKKS